MLQTITTFSCKPKINFMLVLFVIALSPLRSYACKCAALPKLDVDYCKYYDLIFKGVVVSLGKCNEINKAHFKLNELYKGVSPEEIDVYFDCSSDCAMNFNVGEEWIIYSNYIQLGKPKIDFCSRCRKRIQNENILETEFIHTDITYSQEQEFLMSKLGLHHFLLTTNNSELSHQNIKPNRLTTIILLTISISVFVVFYYLFKKFIK